MQDFQCFSGNGKMSFYIACNSAFSVMVFLNFFNLLYLKSGTIRELRNGISTKVEVSSSGFRGVSKFWTLFDSDSQPMFLAISFAIQNESRLMRISHSSTSSIVI